MSRFAKFGIPNNFDELLPGLRSKTLKWETVCRSGTKINSTANISFYQTTNSYGTFILIPGLATNADVDPLMKSITFWALTHRYNIVKMDTFINDFLDEITPEKMKLNTYSEFKTIIHESINFIKPCIQNTYSLIVGHCASANGIIDVFNDCVKNSEPIPVSSALLLAPFPKTPGTAYENNIKRLLRVSMRDLTKAGDPTSKMKLAHMKFLEAMENFRREIENVSFEPDLMIQWGIPVTFVTAQRDQISTKERIDEYCAVLNQKSNNFKHLCLPKKKHTFERLYADHTAIISLIKAQRKQSK